MRLEEDLKYDYKDVLIRPKRSVLKSRSEVSLERKTNFRNYKPSMEADEYIIVCSIMASNMDVVKHLMLQIN